MNYDRLQAVNEMADALGFIDGVELPLDEKRSMLFDMHRPTIRDVMLHNAENIYAVTVFSERHDEVIIVQAASPKKAESKVRRHVMTWLGRKEAYARRVTVREVTMVIS